MSLGYLELGQKESQQLLWDLLACFLELTSGLAR